MAEKKNDEIEAGDRDIEWYEEEDEDEIVKNAMQESKKMANEVKAREQEANKLAEKRIEEIERVKRVLRQTELRLQMQETICEHERNGNLELAEHMREMEKRILVESMYIVKI